MTEQSRHNETPQRMVLIAEDEELLAKAIAATINLEGLQTIIATDGEQALEMARRQRSEQMSNGRC